MPSSAIESYGARHIEAKTLNFLLGIYVQFCATIRATIRLPRRWVEKDQLLLLDAVPHRFYLFLSSPVTDSHNHHLFLAILAMHQTYSLKRFGSRRCFIGSLPPLC
jgi:hypothetical protein